MTADLHHLLAHTMRQAHGRRSAAHFTGACPVSWRQKSHCAVHHTLSMAEQHCMLGASARQTPCSDACHADWGLRWADTCLQP